jgi:hypothetical protein
MKARWFKLVSVNLGNADETYTDGDDVQAIEQWEPPDTWFGVTADITDTILDAIDHGLPNGDRYSTHHLIKGERHIVALIQKHCPGKDVAQCMEMVKAWLKDGTLYKNPDREQKGHKEDLFVNPDKRAQQRRRAA